jgi:hypothetical protein
MDASGDDVLIAGVVAAGVATVELDYGGGPSVSPTYAVPDGYPVRFYILDIPASARIVRFSARDSTGREIGYLGCRTNGECVTAT